MDFEQQITEVTNRVLQPINKYFGTSLNHKTYSYQDVLEIVHGIQTTLYKQREKCGDMNKVPFTTTDILNYMVHEINKKNK